MPSLVSLNVLTVLIISMTFVLSLTQMLVILSLYVVLSILLSILVCVAESLFSACLVRVHFAAPYVVSGNTEELYTCLFRQMATMLSKISRCLEYAVQRATILLFFEYTYPFNIFYQHIIHVDWGVVYKNHLCLCDLHLQTY